MDHVNNTKVGTAEVNVLEALKCGEMSIDWNLIKAAARSGIDTFEWFITDALYKQLVTDKHAKGDVDWAEDWMLEYVPSKLSNSMGQITFKPKTKIAEMVVRQGLVRTMRGLDESFDKIDQYNMVAYYNYVDGIKFGDNPEFQRLLLKIAIQNKTEVNELIQMLDEVNSTEFKAAGEKDAVRAERVFISSKLETMRTIVAAFCDERGIEYSGVSGGMLNAIGHRVSHVVEKLKLKPTKPHPKQHKHNGKSGTNAKKPAQKKSKQNKQPKQHQQPADVPEVSPLAEADGAAFDEWARREANGLNAPTNVAVDNSAGADDNFALDMPHGAIDSDPIVVAEVAECDVVT